MNTITDFGKAICPHCKTSRDFKKGPGPLFTCTYCDTPSTVEELEDFQSYLSKKQNI